MDFKTMTVMPGRVLIRILGKDRKSVYEKKIKKDDGTEGIIYVKSDLRIEKNFDAYTNSYSHILKPLDEADNEMSQLVVNTGIVEGFGEDVTGIEIGDIALLEHTADANKQIIVDWDKDDKIILVMADTKYLEQDIWAYANRQYPKNTLVGKSGEIIETSPIIAVIRNGNIFARHPYVLLHEEPTERTMVGKGGIIYTEKQKLLYRKVISVSELSTQKFGIPNGETVIVKEADTFNIVTPEGLITAVNDADVLASGTLIESVKQKQSI